MNRDREQAIDAVLPVQCEPVTDFQNGSGFFRNRRRRNANARKTALISWRRKSENRLAP
jgi:hypothetical protein